MEKQSPQIRQRTEFSSLPRDAEEISRSLSQFVLNK